MRQYRELGNGIIVSKDLLSRCEGIECVVLDCDGVLIDSRGSYDRAIIDSLSLIFRALLNVEFDGTPLSRHEITMLRRTGGFNSDADALYVLSLLTFISLPREKLDEFVKRIKGKGIDEVIKDVQRSLSNLTNSTNRNDPTVFLSSRVRSFVSEFLERLSRLKRSLTLEEVDEIISELAVDLGIYEEVESFKAVLRHKLGYGKSLTKTMLYDIYYGEEVLREVIGSDPYFKWATPLYVNERPTVDEGTLRDVVNLLGGRRLGMVTGRDSVTTRRTLGSLWQYFDPRACIFIFDEVLRGLPEAAGKPSPYGLIKAMIALEVSEGALYVGNSVEDLLMVKNAAEYGMRPLFMAVTGLSPSPQDEKELFTSLGADVISSSLTDLPYVLSLVNSRDEGR